MSIHGELIKGMGAKDEAYLVGEEVDVRVGDYVEERYYFGRPWSKSDYVVTKRVYKPLNEPQKSEDDLPF